MHLGASMGIPTVGLFSSTNPTWTHPLGQKATFCYEKIFCAPCTGPYCVFGKTPRCFDRLRPEKLIAFISSLENS